MDWGGYTMLNRSKKVIDLYDKPIELMTRDERDEHFMSFSGMKYDEWLEYYENDTPEILEAELLNFCR